MSQENKIHLTWSPEKKDKIRNLALALSNEIMGDMAHLTAEDRREMLKLGEKNLSFAIKSIEYSQKNEQFVPSFMSVADAEVDLDTVDTMRDLNQILGPVVTAVNDTMMLAGSELYQAALIFFRSVKSAAQAHAPGAEAIHQDLSVRFPGGRRRKTPETV